MVLLYWSTIKPRGASNLAAIRFSVPVKISQIRLFPSGAVPFKQCPEIVAQTEPEAFHLNVFFNAIDLRPTEPKDKQRPANALIPTSIAYAGGLVDFTVEPGAECSTRLMLVCGQFEVLTLAVYGEVVSTDKAMPDSGPLSSPTIHAIEEPHCLSASVDIGNMTDPTTVARQLLELMPDSPALPLAIRLMFSLKPAEEDWDHPDFPHLYADLEAAMQSDDLEQCLAYLAKPIREDTPQEELDQFADVVFTHLNQNHSVDAFDLARLLNVCACQAPSLVSALCHRLENPEIFAGHALDIDTLLQLLSAAANPSISNFLRHPTFLQQLDDLKSTVGADSDLLSIAQQLATRTQAWTVFEDSLTDTQPDFEVCVNLLREIGQEEQSLANWLETMLLHEDIAERLRANPVLTKSCPDLLSRPASTVSHDDYIVFVRSFLGVSSVMAVLAWADSVGNDVCRERALAVLRLWQCVDGYSQIVSHLFLIRQMARRLDWITADKDPPRKSGILGEQILLELASSPQRLLNDDLVGAILALKPPLSVISEQERLAVRKAALVVDDGLPAAVDELAFSSDHPLSLRRLRTLRVSVAIVQRELGKENGDWNVMSTSWAEHSISLGTRLVEVLQGVSGDMDLLFSVTSPSVMNHDIASNLFNLSEELLQVILVWLSVTRFSLRTLQTLTLTIGSVFACADLGESQYTRTSAAYVAAQSARAACERALVAISQPNKLVEGGKLCAEVVLRTLLGALDAVHARDPAHHISQIYALINSLLPVPSDNIDSDRAYWLTDVLPTMLSELLKFLRHLDTHSQADFIRLLAALDQDVTGISEWIISEEFTSLRQSLLQAKREETPLGLSAVIRVRIGISLRMFQELATPADMQPWLLVSLLAYGPSSLIAESLMLLRKENMTSSALHAFVEGLSIQWDSIKNEALRYALVTSLFRAAWMDKLQFPLYTLSVVERLKEISSSMLEEQSIYQEIGRFLHFLSSLSSLQPDDAKLALDLMVWINEQSHALQGVPSAAFSKLCDNMSKVLTEERRAILRDVRSKLQLDEADPMSYPLVELPDSFDDLGNLVDATTLPVPSTPKKKSPTPEIFGPMLSPATAILRSPAATGLTKTYNANDFRDLRQAASARQNTSRLPSLHVDDFELPPDISMNINPLP